MLLCILRGQSTGTARRERCVRVLPRGARQVCVLEKLTKRGEAPAVSSARVLAWAAAAAAARPPPRPCFSSSVAPASRLACSVRAATPPSRRRLLCYVRTYVRTYVRDTLLLLLLLLLTSRPACCRARGASCRAAHSTRQSAAKTLRSAPSACSRRIGTPPASGGRCPSGWRSTSGAART